MLQRFLDNVLSVLLSYLTMITKVSGKIIKSISILLYKGLKILPLLFEAKRFLIFLSCLRFSVT